MAIEAIGAAQREIETLAKLEQGLPHAYTVYHGVHWTRVGGGSSMFGEIDFVVVNPVGGDAADRAEVPLPARDR